MQIMQHLQRMRVHLHQGSFPANATSMRREEVDDESVPASEPAKIVTATTAVESSVAKGGVQNNDQKEQTKKKHRHRHRHKHKHRHKHRHARLRRRDTDVVHSSFNVSYGVGRGADEMEGLG